MASRKLDIAFDEINTKYKDASETEIQRGINSVETRLQKLRGDMETKKGEMANKQQLVQLLEGKLKENPNSKGLLKQIETSKKEIATIQKAIDKKQSEIDKAEKRKMNLQGYKNHKQEITRILKAKEQLKVSLKTQIGKRDEAKAQLANARKMLEEVNKKLINEKVTMEMTNAEYNDLLRKRDELPKQIQKLGEAQRHAEQRIRNLQAKIGKCDLAWRTLFVDKDWDEIKRRSTEPNKKFTKQKVEQEKQKESTQNGKQEVQKSTSVPVEGNPVVSIPLLDSVPKRTSVPVEAREEENDATGTAVPTNGATAKGNDIENPDDLFEVKEEKSRLEKIYGVLRKVPGLILFWPFKLVKATVKAPFKLIKFTYKKIKQLIKWLKQKGIGDISDLKKKENPKAQAEPKKEEKKEIEQPVQVVQREEKKETGQPKQETQKGEQEIPRKNFIDGLREFADVDYRKKVRDEKQKAYIHVHEAVKKEEKEDVER